MQSNELIGVALPHPITSLIIKIGVAFPGELVLTT